MESVENAAFIFPNAPTELLNRHYPFVLRPKYHSSPLIIYICIRLLLFPLRL